jgi:glycosyltransferase involved in cell wall biosynthesis
MQKTNVFLVITKSNWGGAQKYVYDIATELAHDERFAVTVVVGGDGTLVTRLAASSIRVIAIPSLIRDVSLVQDIKSFLWLIRLFHTEKPDVLHLNSSKIGGLGGLAGRLAGIKHIIFTVHGWAFNEVRPWYQKCIIRVLAFITLCLAHTTIYVSRITKQSMSLPTFLKKRALIIYNGIHEPLFKERGAFENIHSLANYPRIVSIGELHRNKGYDTILPLLAELQHIPWTYYIIGEGEERENIETMIHNLGLQQRVFICSVRSDAATYLHSFDIFLFPSRTEALGYVAIEAMYAGLPIIAHDVGGIPEVVSEDPFSTLIHISNSAETKHKIEALLTNIPVVNQEKRKGLLLRFSLARTVEETKKLYLLKP